MGPEWTGDAPLNGGESPAIYITVNPYTSGSKSTVKVAWHDADRSTLLQYTAFCEGCHPRAQQLHAGAAEGHVRKDNLLISILQGFTYSAKTGFAA